MTKVWVLTIEPVRDAGSYTGGVFTTREKAEDHLKVIAANLAAAKGYRRLILDGDEHAIEEVTIDTPSWDGTED